MKEQFANCRLRSFTQKVYLDYVSVKMTQGKLATWLKDKEKLSAMTIVSFTI